MTSDSFPHASPAWPGAPLGAGPESIDSPLMRQAGKGLLSLALMDGRNHTLQLFGYLQEALAQRPSTVPRLSTLNPLLWELGHVGWFQERWIGRNLQRARGTRCDPLQARLASIEPDADNWWDARQAPQDRRWTLDLPDAQACRAYLLDTLESTLELLEKSDHDDDALYFYRLSLFHEDLHGEALIRSAQTLGLSLGKPLQEALTPAPMTLREPLWVPATRWLMGSLSGRGCGFAFDNEKAQHTLSVPEFEIDAQPVTWAQYVEFVADGGYDRPDLWQPEGWQWLQTLAAGEGRRGPRHVEQIGVGSGAVVQTRFGQAMRMHAHQPVMHVSWWEADAWCRWAGRRLPAEVEWELAAHTAARRGFHWGDVWEWTGTTFRPYPGFAPDPDAAYSQPCFGTHKVLRGASLATRSRMKHPKFRSFFQPERDDLLSGFRSCAL